MLSSHLSLNFDVFICEHLHSRSLSIPIKVLMGISLQYVCIYISVQKADLKEIPININRFMT